LKLTADIRTVKEGYQKYTHSYKNLCPELSYDFRRFEEVG